jgi:hypothetical protein
MATEDVKNKNATRAQKAKAVHEKNSETRGNEQKYLKAAYLQGNGEVILEDLQKKIRAWIGLNNKVAQDGVGARPTGFKLTDGTPEIENVYLTPEQRASYLDQSKGQQAILDYIERQLQVGKPGDPKTITDDVEPAAEDEPAEEDATEDTEAPE